ncbi:helix-turn-helix transcriptional regulator [Salinirubrum litoreum]|uniref:Helix-turn-helix transcriptional regulator n=1 Tax=Salinirubrum litoreum TaxID=1126234 RepID=A0ABD5R9C0_9EURY|nr:helix-turn-helix domain-containing protein [Salinirubrum litoreum]
MDRSVLLVVLVLIVSATVGTALPATALSDAPDQRVATAGPVPASSDSEGLRGPGPFADAEQSDGAGQFDPAGQNVTAATALQQQEFDRTQYIITVREDTSARWTFRFERPLTNETERQEFRAFAEEFNSTETQLYTNFQRDARGLVAEGANFTGREMTASDFSRDARIESGLNTVGVVEMSFTWSAFAVEDGDRVVVGDVFEDGLYIYRDQSLVMRAGSGLVFDSVTPNGTLSNPDSVSESDSVTWQGEKQFTDNRPQVAFVPASSVTPTATPTATPGPGDSPTQTPGPGDGPTDSGLPLPLVVGVLALVGLLVGGIWYRQRGGGGPSDSGGSPGGTGGGSTGSSTGSGGSRSGIGDSGGASGSGAGSGAGAGGTSDGQTTHGAAAGASGAAGAGAVAGADDDEPMPEPSVPDEELLADDDRVVRMLRQHGGRMKQVKIVDETGWSKSKVSMLLSDMEEEGTISKLRVGRENVISLAGHEPEAAGSPFDDEE